MQDIAERAAETAARRAIEEMLTRIGLDVSEPIKLQTDFAAVRSLMRDQETIDDMIFVRRLRRQMQSLSTRVGYVVLTIVITAIGGLIAFGLRAWLGVFPPPH